MARQLRQAAARNLPRLRQPWAHLQQPRQQRSTRGRQPLSAGVSCQATPEQLHGTSHRGDNTPCAPGALMCPQRVISNRRRACAACHVRLPLQCLASAAIGWESSPERSCRTTARTYVRHAATVEALTSRFVHGSARRRWCPSVTFVLLSRSRAPLPRLILRSAALFPCKLAARTAARVQPRKQPSRCTPAAAVRAASGVAAVAPLPTPQAAALPRWSCSMSKARDQRSLDYAVLQAHGLLEPALVQHPAFIEPAPRAVSPQPEPESTVQLVKNEAGRWQLQRALGESEPPVIALMRPGAEQAAAIRKRKACAHALACLLWLATS